MDLIKNTLNNAYTGVVKSFKAPPQTAQFKETGMLSPEEFIAAGDKLIQVSPQWSWQKAPDSGSQYKYLPADKQFLVLKDCISEKRIKDLMKNARKFMETNTNDGWVIQDLDNETNNKNLEEIGKQLQNIKVTEDNFAEKDNEQGQQQEQQQEEEQKDDDKILTVQQQDLDDEDDGSTPEVRIYTIYICYDGYYYCPRLFLTSVLQSDDDTLDGKPVQLEKVFEDIAAEKVNTTVTIESHPQLKQQMVTIHPCKHAQVLKNFADQIREGRSEDSVGAHLAIILFLKFFHDVIPTVSFDSNFDIDFGAN